MPESQPAQWAPPARVHTESSTLERYVSQCERTTSDLREWRAVRRGHALHALTPYVESLRAKLTRSPFYAEKLHAHGLGPNDLSLDTLASFPILHRREVAAAGHDFPALGTEGDLTWVTSSGSTGQPVEILRTGYECVHMWAVLRFWMALLHLQVGSEPSIVLLCDLPGGMEYEAGIPMVNHGTLRRISTHRPDPLLRLLDARPQVLFSDPTGLHWLERRDLPPQFRDELQLVLTSAQHFGPAQRVRTENATGAPVINYYATTETGPIAWECLEVPERFHVLLPHIWVEDSDEGLLVTRLTPSPTPLLRYATGDRGTVTWESCPCGTQGPCIENLWGRHRCEFRTPDGTPVDAWQLAWAFKHHNVREFCLTQTGSQSFSLALTETSDSGALQERLASSLRRLGFPDPVVVSTPHLPSLKGSKPEPFRYDPG